jgi:hypothetical protein
VATPAHSPKVLSFSVDPWVDFPSNESNFFIKPYPIFPKGFLSFNLAAVAAASAP